MSDRQRKRVVIVYKDLPQYRVPFFEALRKKLDGLGVDLDLVYGQPVGDSAKKEDSRELPWATFVRSQTMTIGLTTFYWQPVMKHVRGSDLVIVEQATRLLVNHALLLQNLLGVRRVALWGHGRNFQAPRPGRLRERFKRLYSRNAHWWFAYNETSAAAVRLTGYPSSRISVVQNAIDTQRLQELVERVTEADREELRVRLGIEGRDVCLFVGGMYAERRLPFLVEAATEVRATSPEFELVLVGSGPERAVAEAAAREHGWVHYCGPLFDEELATPFSMARLLLMPGIVGLGVLDSFAAGVPMVTMALPNHGPEIEYLWDGVNAVIVEDGASPAQFAGTIADLLGDRERYDRLVEGCRASAAKYSVEEMVDRFTEGVMRALEEA